MAEAETITAQVAETAAALLRLARTLAPQADPAAVRAAVHGAAAVARAALDDGATPGELLDALIAATAPAPAAPVDEPWAPFLPMTTEQFAGAGVTLEVWLAPEQVMLWFGESAAPRWAFGTGQVWDRGRMEGELRNGGVPESEWTVGRLVALLGGRVEQCRAPAGA